MRKLAALVMAVSLMPGCCLVGMTVGGASAASRNDERARKLGRGDALDPGDEEPVSQAGWALTGFAAGAVIDAVVIAAVVMSASDSFGQTSGTTGFGYVSHQD